jgi:hypothetical protein
MGLWEKGHRSLKNRMEGERWKGKGMGSCGTPWNLMESHGRRRQKKDGSHDESWNPKEGRTRSVGALEPYGRCWNLLHSLE